MSEVLVAGLLWLGTHLGISSTPLRGVLVSAIGQRGYLALYSLLAFASLGYLIWVYTEVPRFDYLWLPDPALYWPAKLALPVALVLMVGGFMVRNPTMVGVTVSEAQARELATGVTRITRHPFQWAVVLWAVTHMMANGDWVSLIFFGSFAVLSFAGTFLMDAKKNRLADPGWLAYASVTSNVPCAAIVSGRNTLVVRELWLPTVVGLILYALLYYFHEAFTGAVIV
jgi:uncharacterized membrane protein